MNPLRKQTQRQPHQGTETVSPQPQAHPSRQSLAGVRLRKHGDFQRAYTAGRKRQSASMSWFLAPQPADPQCADDELRSGARVGLTVGKVLGKAHERNRIKRRMREALRRHVDLLPLGVDLIFHPRRVVLTMDFKRLESEVVRILEQACGEIRAAQPAAGQPHPEPAL